MVRIFFSDDERTLGSAAMISLGTSRKEIFSTDKQNAGFTVSYIYVE